MTDDRPNFEVLTVEEIRPVSSCGCQGRTSWLRWERSTGCFEAPDPSCPCVGSRWRCATWGYGRSCGCGGAERTEARSMLSMTI